MEKSQIQEISKKFLDSKDGKNFLKANWEVIIEDSNVQDIEISVELEDEHYAVVFSACPSLSDESVESTKAFVAIEKEICRAAKAIFSAKKKAIEAAVKAAIKESMSF